jgi:endonuclease III
MTPKKRYAIFERFYAHNPRPVTELQYNSPFELLIAVILSANATDKSVNKATQTLFKIANTPQKILQLGEEGLKHTIKSIGLFNTKAANIIKTAQILLERYEGTVPNDRQALEALPGVGRKTANVVLNVAFGQPTIPVDTHVFRVANRTKIATGKTRLEVEKQLIATTPPEFIHHAHHWLILHGRYICIARRPRCSICYINDLCEFEHKCL